MSSPLNICFFDAGLEFSGMTDIAEQSLGGSETALYYMARHLAARGHNVRVVCRAGMKVGKAHGVTWFDHASWGQLAATMQFDVFIVNRVASQFSSRVNSNMNVLWCHDMPPDPIDDFVKFLWPADRVMLMSQYQAMKYGQTKGGLPAGWLDPLLFLTRNGVDLQLIQRSARNVKRERKRLLFMSRPERGVQPLLQYIWPALLQEDPELSLELCTYQMKGFDLPEHVQVFYRFVDDLVRTSDRVTNLGPLTKEALYAKIASAGALVYPCHFAEISCISVMEAMACGTPVVTTNGFALTETCRAASGDGHAAVLIDGRPRDQAYQQAFVAETLRLVRDDVHWKTMQRAGLERAAQLDWEDEAARWEEEFYGFFAQRLAAKPRRICQQLIYESDLVIANTMARRFALIEELELTDRLLANAYAEPERYENEEGDEAATSQWEKNDRLRFVAERVPPDAKTLLDVGCNTATLFAHVEKVRALLGGDPLMLTGIDTSERLLAKAATFVAKHCPHPGNITLLHQSVEEMTGQFDVVTCCETLEHMIDTRAFIAHLERLCRPGGRIILTVPFGPWESITIHQPQKGRIREHMHHFHYREIDELFGKKKKFNFDGVSAPGGALSPRGDLCGNWVIYYTHDPNRETGVIDIERKIERTRPYQRLVCHMLTKDEEDHVTAAIKPLLPIVDELIVYDTGSTDRTIELAEAVTKDRYQPEIQIVRGFWDHDFSAARNRAIACARESGPDVWHMYQDADERLVSPHELRKYLTGAVFPGYIIRQRQLMIDMADTSEQPVRLWRAESRASDGVSRPPQFFGVIHEHPEWELNDPLEPMLIIPDVIFAHYGYPTEAVRREKCYKRNLPLLIKDRIKNPTRRVGMILIARDYVNLAAGKLKENRATYTQTIIDWLQVVVEIYWAEFRNLEWDEQRVRYHTFMNEWYQNALQLLAADGISAFKNDPMAVPFEVALALGGGYGGLSKLPGHTRRWFAKPIEYDTWATKQVERLSKIMIARRVGEYIE